MIKVCKLKNQSQAFQITERNKICIKYNGKYFEILNIFLNKDDWPEYVLLLISQFVGDDSIYREIIHWADPNSKSHHFQHFN